MVKTRTSCYDLRYCDFIPGNKTQFFGGAMKFKFAALFSLLVLTAPSAFAGKPPAPSSAEYSADMEMTSNGKPQATGKVFQSGKKQRMEMAGSISITRLDKKVMWQLMPKQKSYMEMAIPEQNIPATEKGDVEMTEMGAETVNGVSATKYKVVSKADGKKGESFMWFTKEGIMVKMEGQHEGKTVGSELKNLKIGKQDGSLFEIPDGYKSMGNPMDMFASMQRKQKAEMKEAGEEILPDTKPEKFTEAAEYSAINRNDARIYSTAQQVVVRPESRGEKWERVYAVIQRNKGTITEVRYSPDMCVYTENPATDPAGWRKEYVDLSPYSIMFKKVMKKTKKGASTIEGMADVTDAPGTKYQGQMTISDNNIVMKIFASNAGKMEGLIEREYRAAKAGKPEASHLDPTKGFKKLSPKEFEKLMNELEKEGGRAYSADDGTTRIRGSFCPKGKRQKETAFGGEEEKGSDTSGGKKAEKGGKKDEEKAAEDDSPMKGLKRLGGKFGF